MLTTHSGRKTQRFVNCKSRTICYGRCEIMWQWLRGKSGMRRWLREVAAIWAARWPLVVISHRSATEVQWGWGRYYTSVPLTMNVEILWMANDISLTGHLGPSQDHGWSGDVFGLDHNGHWCSEILPNILVWAESRKKSSILTVLKSLPLLGEHFSQIGMNLVNLLIWTSQGLQYELKLFNYASRYSEVYAIRNMKTSVVARALMNFFAWVRIPLRESNRSRRKFDFIPR